MIPRRLHHIWTGPPLPDHLAEYVGTWEDLHPTWQHTLWRFDDLAATLTGVARTLFLLADDLTAHPGQFRADVARYWLLHHLGGVYVDCDFEARRPLDPLLDQLEHDGRLMFAAWETNGTWVNNAIIGAAPGSLTLFCELIRALPDSVRNHPGERPNVVTGPQYLTPWLLNSPERSLVEIFPSEMFYPYRWDELDRQTEEFPNAYAVHHWDNARRRRAGAGVR